MWRNSYIGSTEHEVVALADIKARLDNPSALSAFFNEWLHQICQLLALSGGYKLSWAHIRTRIMVLNFISAEISAVCTAKEYSLFGILFAPSLKKLFCILLKWWHFKFSASYLQLPNFKIFCSAVTFGLRVLRAEGCTFLLLVWAMDEGQVCAGRSCGHIGDGSCVSVHLQFGHSSPLMVRWCPKGIWDIILHFMP